MSNVLAYKGYFAPVEFDAEQHMLAGMVAGIKDAIVFEGSTVCLLYTSPSPRDTR